MAGPFDYTLQVSNPFQSALQGYRGGLALNEAQQQQQVQQVELQQKQAQMQAQQRMQEDLYALSTKPNATGADYAAVMARNPSLSKQLGESWATLNTAQQQSKLQQGTQAYAAIQAGRPDLAEQLFTEQATAARNSGDEATAKQAETMARLVKEHPETAKTTIALSLSSHLGPEKFAETFAKLGGENRANAEEARKAELQPSVLAKSQADAQTAITGAKFAESKAVQELRMGEEQIKKWAADTEIARMNSRIAAMNAATSRESNDLKRQELGIKLQDAVDARDSKLREKNADFQAGHAVLSDAMRLVSEIKSNKIGLAGATGGTSWGSFVPGTPSADAAAKIEQLENILAAANLDKLKGPMSDKDIVFLKRISANLNRKQSSEQFLKELDKVEDAVIRNEKILRGRFGSAATPVPETAPTGPAPKNRGITVDW